MATVCGIGTDAVLSEAFGAELLNDCRSIGIGEVIEGGAGSGMTGLAPTSSAGD
jgi:hypothetical protein